MFVGSEFRSCVNREVGLGSQIPYTFRPWSTLRGGGRHGLPSLTVGLYGRKTTLKKFVRLIHRHFSTCRQWSQFLFCFSFVLFSFFVSRNCTLKTSVRFCFPVQVQCCFTSTETRDTEPWTATSTFTQLLGSAFP